MDMVGAGKIAESVSSIFSSTMKGLDELFTSDEERIRAQAILKDAETRLQTVVEGELTKRHQADMASDSWLAKNVRPMTLAAVIGLFVILAILNGFWGMNISEKLISILESWGMIVFSFYFGSRGLEKMVSMIGTSLIGRGKNPPSEKS